MQRLRTILKCAAGTCVFAAVMLVAQAPAAAPANPSATAEAAAGGRLHGVVKSGNIPLPGVAVIARNTLTGKRYSTTTDITGAWSLAIPENGRYVIRTQFAAFAPGSQEAVLNDTGRDRTVDFQLILASRAAAEEQQQARQQTRQSGEESETAQSVRQLAGNGAENLALTSALNSGTETGMGTAGASGTELPTIASNSDFNTESVNVTGQSGQVSPMAGVDMDRLREEFDNYRAQNGGNMPGSGGLFGGGPFGGGGFAGPGGGGPGGGGGRGGFGGGRGNFRGFNPAQPHGAIFWTGSNSALNAQPFSLLGQQQEQPANGTNRFGLTFMSAPYIPGLTKPSGKDTIFLTISGQRNSNPDDFYGTVPTLAERSGDFSADRAAIYDPVTGQQFVTNGTPNVIPQSRITTLPAYLLMNCPAATPNCQPLIPYPNFSSAVNGYNYHLLTTAQSNSTQAGVRYMRSLGANAMQPGGRGMGGWRRNQAQGLRQSINGNFNWSHSASDGVNIFPQLGGKSASDSYSVQAGYTIGYNKLTSIFNANWNRSNSNTTNFFTNTTNDVASNYGITLPNDVPLNYGLPSISISNLPTSVSQTQPSFSLSQTISLSETLSWIRGKHNLRFGGDYRRVHRDFLAGSNPTGNFSFTGWFTEAGSGTAKDPSTGSAIADFLLGYPVTATINSSLAKSYLRDNVMDAYAFDDWRVLPYLTLNYGLRYEYFAPYTEKYNRLAMVDTNPDDLFTQQTEVNAGNVGSASGIHFPNSLVYPWRKAFAPRVGVALRLPHQTVIRAGFGMNYTVGEYATFATAMAHEPPFTNQQTNNDVSPAGVVAACAQSAVPTCFTNGLSTPATEGNFALNPHYGLPYVMSWNLDVQKTLPLGIVMNVGYNGSKANHLDEKIAPRSVPASLATNPGDLVFNYDFAAGFYKMSAGTVRVNKRLSKGVAMGANYQFAHGTDNASSINGSTGGTVAQNWLDLAAEEGNSNAVPRQSVSGNYLFELPFGENRLWATSGKPARIFDGFSVSGSFIFATGVGSAVWLTPAYTATATSLTCGTAGALRANRNPGVPAVFGGRQWINPAAYSLPASTGSCDVYGDAPRNSITAPGTVTNNMALSKTTQFGDTRSLEIRATINNAFNTVQYTGVNATVGTTNFGQVSSVGNMRSFQFLARFRY